MKSLIQKIKESVAVKWIALYYTFFFLFGGYIVLQIVTTALILLIFNTTEKSIDLGGFDVVIDGVDFHIWNLPEFYIATIISSIVISIFTILVTKLIMMDNPYSYLGLKKIKKQDYRWFIYSLMVLITGVLLIEVLGIRPETPISAHTILKKTLLVVGLVIFAPLVEELLFRGFLLTRMSSLLSDKKQWVAVLITAILFATLHFQYNIFAMLYILAIGFFMGCMKLKTDNLWFPIIFHMAGNMYAALPILID